MSKPKGAVGKGFSKREALNRLHTGVWSLMGADCAVPSARWYIKDGVRVYRDSNSIEHVSSEVGALIFYEIKE